MTRADLPLVVRIVLGVSLLWAVLATALSWSMLEAFDEQATTQELQRIQSVADVTAVASAPALDFGDHELLAERLDLLGASPGALWAVVTVADARVAQWGKVPQQLELEGDELRAASTVRGRAGTEGELVVGFSRASLAEARAENHRRMWGVMFPAWLVACALGFALATWLSRPLEQLTMAAHGIRAGTLHRGTFAATAERVQGYRRDEVMVLHHALATMAGRAEEQMEALRLAREEAEQRGEDAVAASKAKSRFLANMSHELRTPLNAIVGYSDMLVDDLEEMEVDEVRADLDRIRQSSTHLLSLISNILDLSKVEAGRMEIFCEPVDLSAVVQEAVAVVAPQLRDRGNELHVDLPDDLPVLHTDLTKLRQCLLNLLSNAVKFTQNGRIDLRVREVDIGQLQVEVEDTGVGMTPAQLDRLFQEFSQADASTTRRYGGTGLGLALSRHLLELIGGHIHVRSEYGRGTCFTIDLPTRLATPTGAGLRVVRLEQLKAPRAERIDDGAGAAAR